MEERGPVRLGQVEFGSARFCKDRRFLVRPGCAGRASAGRGFALYGKVRFYLVWFGDALFGVVGSRWGTALNGKVRSYCGEALHAVVKFCPVKHCYARHARVFRGGVEYCYALLGLVLYCEVRCALALSGGVKFGFALSSRVMCCKVWFHFGLAMQGGVLLSTPRHGKVTRR